MPINDSKPQKPNLPQTSRNWRPFLLLSALLALLVGALFFFFAPQRIVQLFRRDTTWQTMQTNGVWRVGMDPSFPPFEWLDETGKPVGFDVELAERIAADWGMQVEIVPIGFDSLTDAVQTGRIDSVVSALPFDERLTRNLAYSQPYFDAGLALAVRNDSSIQSVDTLTGHTIAVEWGSLGDMVGRRLQREDSSITLTPFETPADAIAALVNQPEIDALLVDHVTLRVAQVNGAPLRRVGPILESNPYVIAMPIRAYELQDALQTTLTDLQAEGVFTELESKWFLSVN
ncbi:MAG: transporter substrate-binding domain-containing protein [Caldilineaceae bacterium]